MFRNGSILTLLLLSFCAPVFTQEQPDSQKSAGQVPVISAELGECSAEIHVTGSKLKPLYKAKIETTIKYGFAGFRRLTLEIYTDVDGRARFEGLPERPRSALSFDVTYEGRKTTVIVHPVQQCHGTYQAIVTDKPVESDEESE